MTTRYPVQIQTKREDGRLIVKATTSIERIAQIRQNPDQELRAIELDCQLALVTAREAISFGSNTRRRDPRAFWFAAKALREFLERLKDSGFYLVQQNDSLGAALEVSGVSVKKLLAFHKRFPDVRLVDPSISWKKYRDNQVSRQPITVQR